MLSPKIKIEGYFLEIYKKQENYRLRIITSKHYQLQDTQTLHFAILSTSLVYTGKFHFPMISKYQTYNSKLYQANGTSGR